jgi:Fe-S cluster assembly iron-binding protein IscA
MDTPDIALTEKARARLLAHLADDKEASYVRIRVQPG